MRTIIMIAAVLAVFAFPVNAQAGKPIKAGFVYVGPVADLGWTSAHDVARKYAEKTLGSSLVTTYVESVPEGDADRFIDRLVNEEKCDVIFTTSFGYMDATVAAGGRFPKTLFFHCSGFKQSKNVGTFFAELYQTYYINGLMAGALSKSGKAGYVGAFPTSEVIRHINAFALGFKAANPKGTVSVRWINSWYDPSKAKEAAEALVAEGCDALAFTEDSSSVIEVAQNHTKAGKQVYAFSHYSPMEKYGPDSVVSGELVNWGPMYVQILKDVQAGKIKDWSKYDLYWKAKEGAAILGSSAENVVNPKFVSALKAV
jgi:basic membrane protein A